MRLIILPLSLDSCRCFKVATQPRRSCCCVVVLPLRRPRPTPTTLLAKDHWRGGRRGDTNTRGSKHALPVPTPIFFILKFQLCELHKLPFLTKCYALNPPRPSWRVSRNILSPVVSLDLSPPPDSLELNLEHFVHLRCEVTRTRRPSFHRQTEGTKPPILQSPTPSPPPVTAT